MRFVEAAIFFAAMLILAFLVGRVLWAIAQRSAKKFEAEMSADDFRVRPPNINFILSIIFAAISALVVSSVFTKGVTDNEEILLTLLVATFMLLPALGFFMFRLNCRITVKGNRITHTTSWGKDISYAFDHITTVKKGLVSTRGGSAETVEAYHGKKLLFRVTEYWPGYKILAARLESEGVFTIGIKDKLPTTYNKEML
jgi:hypothetical protein